jgi:uncharacterized damage-inducible protein DinB
MSTKTGTTTREVGRLSELIKRAYEGEAWHGPSLREALEGVDARRAAARPIAGGHSIWEIALHISGWNDVATRRLAGEQLDEPDEGDFPAVTDTSDAAWQHTLDELARRSAALHDAVAALDDAALDASEGATRYAALHGTLHHIHYHTGQISVLKKAE